jgi:hypothetical protein
MGAQHPVDMLVPALTEQVQVKVANGGTEAIRVLTLHPIALRCSPAQAIVWCGGTVQCTDKEIGIRQSLHGQAALSQQHLRFYRGWKHCPQLPLAALAMATQDLKRIAMASFL